MLDSLQFGVMLAESGLLDEAVREVMMRPQLMMIAESSPGIQSAMKSQVSKWKSQIRAQLGQITIEEKFADFGASKLFFHQNFVILALIFQNRCVKTIN